jgi:hypothetical protein
MAVHFLDPILAKRLRKKNARLYRFVTIRNLKGTIQSGKIRLSYPETDWNDPYEKYFLQSHYNTTKGKQKLPARNRIFGMCFSERYNSEAFWQVYSPNKDGIKATIRIAKLITYLEKIRGVDFYFGKVNYKISSEFAVIPQTMIGLKEEIEQGIVGSKQIELMMIKRKAFLYEEEIRLYAVTKVSGAEFYIDIDLNAVVEKYHLDPRMEKRDSEFYKAELIKHYRVTSAQLKGRSTLFVPAKPKTFTNLI